VSRGDTVSRYAIKASIRPGNSARDGTIRLQKSTRLLISNVLNALSPRHKSACGSAIGIHMHDLINPFS